MSSEDNAILSRSAHGNVEAPGRAREAESRSGKGGEAGGNGEHVPAAGETGGEAGREIRVRAEAGDKPTDNPGGTQQVPS